MVALKSVQRHPGLTYIFNFGRSGTLAFKAERQSARISKIINADKTWVALSTSKTTI